MNKLRALALMNLRYGLLGDDLNGSKGRAEGNGSFFSPEQPTSYNKKVAGYGRFRGLRPNRPVNCRDLGARFQECL